MPNDIVTITYTAGLIEKLAGIKKPAAPNNNAIKTHHDSQLANAIGLDKRLKSALDRYQLVGKVLVKVEEDNAEKLQQLTEALLKDQRLPQKPIPCEMERDICTKCYQEHSQDPLKCAEFVRAYRKCSLELFQLDN